MKISFIQLKKGVIWISASLFCLAWLLPNHYLPWMTAYQEFAGFFAGILLLVVLLFKMQRLKLGMTLFIIISVIPALQYFSGLILFSGDALIAGLYILAFFLMLMAGYNLTLDSELREFWLNLLFGVFIVGAIVSLWAALYQWLQCPESIWVVTLRPGMRPFANFAQPNNLATMLCMGVAGLLYFYEKHFLGRVAAVVLAFFLIFGVALTQSRTPWVSVLTVIVFLIWKSSAAEMRLTKRCLIMWGLVYVLCIICLPYISRFLLSSGVIQSEQGMERLKIWGQLWYAVMEGGIWGYGWNQIGVAQVYNTLAFPVPIATEHSHNIMLDLLLWNGPLLGSVVVILIACWLAQLGCRARSKEGIFALVASGFILTHGMSEFPLEYAFFLLPLGLLLGVVEAEHFSKFTVSFPRWLFAVVLFVACGLFVRVWYEYQIVETNVQLLRFENARVGSIKGKSIEPDVVLLNQLRDWAWYARKTPAENMSSSELELMRKVSRRYPNAPSLLRYAQALALNGQPEAAKEQMLILRGLHGEQRYKESYQALLLMQEAHPQLANLIALLPALPKSDGVK